MDFECKELEISDEHEFGCTISFHDVIQQYNENQTIEEMLGKQGKYLLIQRSYPEEEDEIDWYTVEYSENEIDFSQRDKIYVKMSQDEIEIYCAGVTVVIGLKQIKDSKCAKLKKLLKTIFKDKVVFLD